ncbi:DUF1993 domain-containing protein [Metapseudomonas lalkuanensis]|uniref:DUF1993 domain-containing protein n=1 Tax=Metapseudomonas lalkuanensis TaxID=2604832 RepID=A0A5J6QIT0_9GAMM|nr:DUF1993 domain-containing protein [Pseudomonas lalkuanensis]QEY62490.1 DUF1993 domain-containing protein [Pseudomonas lalkuanensis]UCO96218.1 DUF1993 domain-containing protein [Pseudomonas lalkuanensis]
MSLSMYEVSIPVLARMLGNLSNLLKKGEANAQARSIDPKVYIDSRLAPDMYPLARQVQIASDMAKGCAARLAGVEVPSWEDTESTFDELQARIAKTLDFIKGIDAAKLEGSETRTVVLKMRSGELSFSGRDYLLGFAMPNFYFHVTAAYAILRYNGVDVGKMDYLGGV